MGKSSIQGVTGKRSFPDGIDPDGLVKIDRIQGWISITLYVCPSVCVLLCLSVPQSVYVATFANWSSRCLPLSLSYFLSLFLSLSLSLSPDMYILSVCMYVCLCLSLSLSISLSLYFTDDVRVTVAYYSDVSHFEWIEGVLKWKGLLK